MFTYYTIIGRDLNLFKGHVKNIKEYAGFDKMDCDKEFIAIVYRNNKIPKQTTEEILDFCEQSNIESVIYDESTNSFLDNLYACWNLGYHAAKDGWVFRGGSDQVFSKNSFPALLESANSLKNSGKKFILQANTIENADMLKSLGCTSRHLIANLGNTFDEFNYERFEYFVSALTRDYIPKILTNKEALENFKAPGPFMSSLGFTNRNDGCSWLMKREEWEKYGPMIPIKNGITGDVTFLDSLQLAGYESLMVRDCITYHFIQGESKNR